MLETAWESRWLPDSWYGGVAQLGEHLPCKQGVKGSNPSISIRCGFLKHLCTLKIAYRKRYNIFNTKDTRHPRKIKVCNTNNLKPTFVTLYRLTLVRGVKRLFVGTAFLLMSFASQMTSRCFLSPYECEHSPAFGIINCRLLSILVKLIRAQGGCLGTKSR